MKTKTPGMQLSAILLPRLGELLFAALFAAVIGLGPRLLNVDGDLGRHLTLGGYILDSRSIPTQDIFSFTKFGDALTPHEWLADVIFAISYRAAGLDGVVWLTALVLGGSFWLVYRHSLNLSNMRLIALAGAILAAAASSFHWLTRPHIFTILLTAIWTFELDRLRLGLKRNWYIFPILMLLWVNFHGAFIAGFVIWAAFLAGMILDRQMANQRLLNFSLIGLTSFLMTFLNPDRLGIWRTAFGFLGNRYLVSHTAEYLPPDFQSPIFWPFLAVIGLSLAALALSRSRLNFSHLLLVGAWTAMALYSARNIPLYLVVVMPILCQLFGTILADYHGVRLVDWALDYQAKVTAAEKQIKGGLWAAAVILGSLVLLISGFQLDFQKKGNHFSPDVFPVEAVSWLREHPIDGNGFNYFPWGGYLLYRTWPERLVFIDGQTDFYGEELTREYEQVITLSPGWEQKLTKYQVMWVIMPGESRLASRLNQESDWEMVYEDQTAQIFTKRVDQ